MKNGGAMDGALSHSPQVVRDAVKPDAQPQQEDHRTQRTEGLWGSRPG